MYPNRNLIEAWTLATSNGDQSDSLISERIHSFEVQAPLIVPSKPPTCSINLVSHHKFANSYGNPFVGTYNPDKNCGTNWELVVLNYHGEISGVQFDRVGGVWIGGSELLRYTGAEPSGSSTTYWDVAKNVTEYTALFRTYQEVVVSLDNVVNEKYTGIFDISVSLDFYKQDMPSTEADLIIPFSKSNNSYGWLEYPKDQHITKAISIPQNAIKAEVKVFISPHASDEFWYSNVPSSIASAENGLNGGGAFKEFQLFLDDNLIGVEWPFPTIYTGGFNPLLWRPVVPIGAYTVPEMVFDITPFLPLFFTSAAHSLRMNISTSANPLWFVDANIKVWLDNNLPSDHQFQGSFESKEITSTNPVEIISGTLTDALTVITTAKNSYSVTGTILTSKGWKRTFIDKTLEFKNYDVLMDGGNDQKLNQTTKIITTTLETLNPDKKNESISSYYDQKYYPLFTTLVYTQDPIKNSSKYNFDVAIDHGLEINNSLFQLKSNQNGYGNFGNLLPKASANLNQTFSFQSKSSCYIRDISIEGREIVKDFYQEDCS